MKFVCKTCGGEFERPSDHGPAPSYCKPCQRERLRAQWREFHARERAGDPRNEKVVRKCRLCGRQFEQDSLPIYGGRHISNHFVMRSYCPRCTERMRDLQRRTCHRYMSVVGHGPYHEADFVRPVMG